MSSPHNPKMSAKPLSRRKRIELAVRKYIPHCPLQGPNTKIPDLLARLKWVGIEILPGESVTEPWTLHFPFEIDELTAEVLKYIPNVQTIKALLCANKKLAEIAKKYTMIWTYRIERLVGPKSILKPLPDPRKTYWGILAIPLNGRMELEDYRTHARFLLGCDEQKVTVDSHTSDWVLKYASQEIFRRYYGGNPARVRDVCDISVLVDDSLETLRWIYHDLVDNPQVFFDWVTRFLCYDDKNEQERRWSLIRSSFREEINNFGQSCFDRFKDETQPYKKFLLRLPCFYGEKALQKFVEHSRYFSKIYRISLKDLIIFLDYVPITYILSLLTDTLSIGDREGIKELLRNLLSSSGVRENENLIQEITEEHPPLLLKFVDVIAKDWDKGDLSSDETFFLGYLRRSILGRLVYKEDYAISLNFLVKHEPHLLELRNPAEVEQIFRTVWSWSRGPPPSPSKFEELKKYFKNF